MKKIMIVGLGAIGSNLAMSLIADCREHEYFLLDRGKVEPRNLQAHTQAYLKEQIDMPKAKALRLNVYNLLGIEAEAVETEIKRYETPPNTRVKIPYVVNGKPDLILDCLDNYEGRKSLFNYARRHNCDCLHIGFSPQFTFEISWNKSYAVPEDVVGLDICQLEGASSFVKYVASLASGVVQDFLRSGKKRNLIGNRFSIREI